MKKWQEITLRGTMNVSVLLFGSGLFSIMVGDKSFNDATISIIVGVYGMLLSATVSYLVEE